MKRKPSQPEPIWQFFHGMKKKSIKAKILNVGEILSDLYEGLLHNNVTHTLLDSPYIFTLPENSGPRDV